MARPDPRAVPKSLQADRRVLLDRFRVVDLARKAVGVGSVGTRAWLFLLLDESGIPFSCRPRRPPLRFLPLTCPDRPLGNQGQRVVEKASVQASKRHHARVAAHPGSRDGGRRDFYVRQFRDWKGGFGGVGAIDGTRRWSCWLRGLAAGTLARAHARSGDRRDIAAYLGSGETGADGDGDGEEFDEAVADFAVAYADKNDHNHAALSAAVESGRVPATRDL